MALMNLNIDGVLTVEKVVIPADGITVLGHSLFRGEKIIVRYNGDELTRGQDFIPDRIDDRLYFQKNVCLFTVLKISNESLFGKEIEVEYFACGDYINAEIWNEYPSVASLKQSLASKVDNSDFIKEVKRINSDINGESTARTDADNTLQDNINTETNLRIAEDGKLQTNINNESTARTDADNTLQDNINAEATSRQTADNEIRNELSSETNLRLAGDAVLQKKIDTEMSTRAENDSSLQSQILDLKTKFESFVPGLTYKVVSALPTADILNDVIYLVPADSTGSQNVYNEYLYIDGNWELIGTTATTQAITVDSALSETSTNPVQNKVITAELESMDKVYTSLKELGLTSAATVDNVLSKLQPGETFIADVTQFTAYQTLFPYDTSNDQYSSVFIQQGTSLATAYVKWFRKDGSREALANLNSNNKVKGWNEHTMNEIIHTSLTESLSGITTTLDLINALITEYRAKQKPVRFISGSITKNQLTDFPSNYGLLDIKVAGYDLTEVSFARSEHGFKIMYYGFLNRTSRETLFSKLTWSKSNNIYYTIEDLNAIKGTNIELVKGEDNTIKIIEALGDREEFVERFNNGSTMDRFGIPDEFGNKITYLRIIKTDSKYALIIATTNKGFTFSRVYNLGVLEDWCYDRTKATLVTNATTLKLDVTKRNTSWYGAIKLTYLYDTSPVEVEIDFRNATDTLKWTISKGQKYIKKITYTQDSSNKAHYTIGIEFSGTTYGCYQAEVIGGFADINSLTKDAFTGDTTAVYGNPYGKNNGVTLVSAPEDLGLTSPCTTVQLVQAMRNTFNKTITSGAIGVFNNDGNTITDAPSDYGLLHIEVFGHDRVMIRYDGIGGSTYAGSWIGQIVGSNGTFSSIAWRKIGYAEKITGYTVKNTSYYKDPGVTMNMWKKNGIAFVNLQVECLTPSVSDRTFIEGLPPAAISLYFEVKSDNYVSELHVSIDTSGKLSLSDGIQGQLYRVAFSYPIDD